MYQIQEQRDKPYSDRQIANLRRAFKGLDRAKYSKSVEAYTSKVLAICSKGEFLK